MTKIKRLLAVGILSLTLTGCVTPANQPREIPQTKEIKTPQDVDQKSTNITRQTQHHQINTASQDKHNTTPRQVQHKHDKHSLTRHKT